jgi:hypothetical protein
VQERRRFVGTEIEYSNDCDLFAKSLEHRRQRLRVLLLARPVTGIEERELGAQKSDSLRTGPQADV